jgi:hypothetical protein
MTTWRSIHEYAAVLTFPLRGPSSRKAICQKFAAFDAVSLPRLRLRRLEVVTIKINVLWADGTRPERSNIYFKNILYPGHGGTLPQIDNGTGKFTLPKGFEYDAVASVECEAGKVIESRESRPNQRINVADGLFPAEMTFVIPGLRCTLWLGF